MEAKIRGIPSVNVIIIKAGVKVIIQPGGSIRDQEIINLANKSKVKMLFTGLRHFNH